MLRGAQESTPLEVFQTRTDSLFDLPGMVGNQGWVKINGANCPLKASSFPSTLWEKNFIYYPSQSLICWVWRTLFYPRIEKGNTISQLWVPSKTLIMSWWNIMSLLLLSYFTRQLPAKYLSIRNSSHESKFWTTVPLNWCSLTDCWHMRFLKQTIKSPNKAKDEREFKERITTIYR